MAVETNVFDSCETYQNCTVQVLSNSVTGETSIGWWQTQQDSGPRCPYCGGLLSEIRRGNIRHCYSCHFEFDAGAV